METKLKTGPTRRVHANNARGAAFCGLGAFVGVGKTQRAHVYTAASLPVGPDDYRKIDPEKLARELEVDTCAVNSGRFWMMDEVDYAGGDTVDFHDVRMNRAGDMTGAEMVFQFQSAYVPSLIQRNTVWTFHAGKPVHLHRARDPARSSTVRSRAAPAQAMGAPAVREVNASARWINLALRFVDTIPLDAP